MLRTADHFGVRTQARVKQVGENVTALLSVTQLSSAKVMPVSGRGHAKNIVCPLHRWTYGLDGKLLGAPHFPHNSCLDLAQTPLANWNGLLFEGPRDVARDLGTLRARVQ